MPRKEERLGVDEDLDLVAVALAHRMWLQAAKLPVEGLSPSRRKVRVNDISERLKVDLVDNETC